MNEEKLISFYNKDGTLEIQQNLTRDNIKNTLGMMIRCVLNNGAVFEGYSDPLKQYEKDAFDGSVHESIYLWTWEHLDEETHKLTGDINTKYDQIYTPVTVDDIVRIDAILHSNPRWGGMPTNRFFIDTNECDKRNHKKSIEELRQALVDGGRKRTIDPEYRQKSDEAHERFKKYLYGYSNDE